MVAIREILRGGRVGEEVELRGWIHRTRSSGGIVFAVLRDASGIVQVTVGKKGVPEEAFRAAESALVESSVIAHGTVVEDPRAPGGVEVRASDFRVVHFAEKFPITEDQSEEFLLDVRHLWIRSPKMANVWKVRHTAFGAVHEYWRSEGFYEMDPPMITPAGSEGGSTLFELDYFGRKAYLTQSWQLYAEAMIYALGNVYCVAPSFRAEKSRTSRHLTEYWHCEMEMAWAGLEEILRHGERVVSHVCARVAEDNPEEVAALGRPVEYLKAIRPPFDRMTYKEALDVLKAKGMDVPWGKDLRTEEERLLAEGRTKPVFVTHYPKVSQAFYKARDPEDPEVVLNFDLLAPDDVGELIGGSVREPDLDTLVASLKESGEDPANYAWYLDTRRYGSVPHAGFGMGMERLVQFICKLDHIRDAIPFPRTPARFAP